MNEYPNLWKRGLIQRRVRQLAGHRCEDCGMEFVDGSNLAVSVKRRDGRPMVGTVHHIDGDRANCTMKNLVYLCQRCHCYIQWRWKPGAVMPVVWRNQPREWMVARELVYEKSQQLALFD